jgi:iron complex outermembrane receptor protein
LSWWASNAAAKQKIQNNQERDMRIFGRRDTLSLKHAIVVGCTSTAMLVPATGTHAQGTASPTSTPGVAEETSAEIIVTATKRAGGQLLQRTPAAITALTGQQVEASVPQDIGSVGNTVPNAQFKTNTASTPGTVNFHLRAAGSTGGLPSEDPGVSIVVDGMSLGNNIGAATDVFDLESVEILRGPQGTLFGRNAVGGVVVIRSARPTGEFGAKLRLGVGNLDERDIAVSLQGPLGDMVSAKLAVMYNRRDGYLDNFLVGRKIGKKESLIIRPIVSFKPGDGIELTLIGEKGRQTGDGPAARDLRVPAGVALPTRKFQSIQDYPGNVIVDWAHVIGEANVDLFGGKLTSITAYRRVHQDSGTDVDGGPTPVFHIVFRNRQKQFSQELRWNGEILDNINLTTGLYYFKQDLGYSERRRRGPPVFPLSNIGTAGYIQHSNYGAFVEGEWALSSRLSLVAGGRFTYEKKSAQIATLGVDCPSNPDLNGPINIGACNLSFRDSRSWKNFGPKVTLSYQANPDTFFYGTWSKGFRGGGYVIRSAIPGVPPGPYDPEEVSAFEVGNKLQLFDRKFRLNTAVFYEKYSQLQRTVLDSLARQRVLNAAAAKVYGFETEASLRIASALTLTGSIGYTKTKYESYAGLIGATKPIGALDITFTPRWTANAGISYDLPLGNLGSVVLAGNYSYQSRYWFDDANTLAQNGYGLIDASATYAIPNSRAKIMIFAKNIANKLYYDSKFFVGPYLTGYVGTPRTYGARFSVEF